MTLGKAPLQRHSFSDHPWFPILLLSLYLATAILIFDQGELLKRWRGLGTRAGDIVSWSEFFIKRGVFLAQHVVAISCIALAALAPSRRLGIAITCLSFTGLAIEFSYFYIRGVFPNLNDLVTIYEGIGEAVGVTQEYWPFFAKGIGTALAITLPGFLFLLSKRRKPLRYAGRLALGLLVVLASFYVVVAKEKGEAGLVGFPRGFSALIGGALLSVAVERPTDTGLNRLTAITRNESIRNIVVVMDESVTTSVFREVAGPLLKTPDVYVFPGAVFSGANISAASNYFFRKTIVDSDGRHQIASFFELAKTNGFSTLYIDNQGVIHDPGAKNYFDRRELQFVDKLVDNSGLITHERDRAAVDQIEQWLKSTRNGFVLINKQGSHIPYETSIAPESRRPDRWDNYRESIRINSVELLLALRRTIDENTLVIYTSDHGQNVGSHASHGNPGSTANPKEWEVPFVVLSKNRETLDEFLRSRFLAAPQSVLTHDDISEIVRNTLGFSSRQGQRLIELENSRTDYCGHFGPPYAMFAKRPQDDSCKLLKQ